MLRKLKKKIKKDKTAPKPYKLEDGYAHFKFKMKATGKNKKTNEAFSQKPALFDAEKNPFPQSQSIWGGTKGKVAFRAKGYYVPALGAGVTLQLKAVQIIDLVEGGSKQGDLLKKKMVTKYRKRMKYNRQKFKRVQISIPKL